MRSANETRITYRRYQRDMYQSVEWPKLANYYMADLSLSRWPELIDQNPVESLRPNLNSATYFEIACVAVTHQIFE